MVNIFESEGVAPPKNIFENEGVSPPLTQEINRGAVRPLPLHEAPEDVRQEESNHRNEIEQIAPTVFSDQELEQIRNKGPIGFWEASDFLTYKDVLPGGGVYQAADLVTLNSAAEKMKKGEKTSVNEDEVMRKFLRKHVEMNMRGLSIGGGISYYGSQTPAFMVEFAATGGVGKAAAEGVEAVTKKAIKKGIVQKVVATTAKTAANVAARTAVMPQRYVPQYAELRLNDFMAVTDKGSVIFKESKETPAVSALKAFGYTSAEVASELSGAALSKYVVQPVVGTAGRYLRTPVMSGINKIPANVRANLFNAYQKINPNARVSKVFTAAGWNGMLEEMGEERISAVLQASLDMTLDEDYTFDDYLSAITPTKDELLIEAGIIGITGGVKASADIATNLLTEKLGDPVKARETVENMSATEQETLINEQLRALTEAHEQLRIGLELDPISADQQQAAQKQDPPLINNNESTFERIRRDWDDDMRPIQRLVEEAERRGADIKPGTDPYKMARQFRKIGGMTENVLRYNTYYIDENGNGVITGKSMQAVLDDFDAAVAHVETDRGAREQDFDDYLIARRINEDLIPNPDIEVSAKDAAMAESTMRRLSDKYGDELTWFKKFSDEFYDFKRRVMQDFLVREGVVSEEFAQTLQDKHARHVPFERVFEENQEIDSFMGKQFSKASSKSIIKKMFGGSERDIKSPTRSTMKQTMKIVATAHRNRVARQVADLAEFVPEHVQKVKTPMQKITVKDPDTGKEIDTYRPTGIAPKGTITAYIDGKPQYYKLSEPLLQAMEGMPQSDLAGVWKAMQILSGAPLLTRGATRYNPDFVFKNIVRDQLQAVIMSKARPIPFVDLSKGMAASMGKSEYYQQWLASGGKMSSFMDLSDNAMEKAMKELMNEKSSKLKYLNPLNIIGDIVDFSEVATRTGVYIKAKQQGMSDIDAALESLEASVDFTRGGRVSKITNKFIPFFNAGVQGTTKFVRAFKEHPVETAMWATATITIPNLMVTAYYLYGAPEEDREEYLNFPEWVHALSTPIKAGDTWYYIPKPFAPGYIFGSMPQMFMMWMYKENKPEAKEFALQMAQGMYGAMTPWYDESSLLPTSVRVMIENTTNHSFFLGRSIYPDWMENHLPEDKTNKYTSETAKLIGSGLDASPAIVDNTIRGFLGGGGRYITDAGDWIINDIKRARGEDVPADPASVKNIPIVRAFAHHTPTGYRAETTQTFFDKWEKIGAIHRSYNKKEGEAKAEFRSEYSEQLRAYKPMKSFYDRMREFGKRSDAIYDDTAMSPQEKAEALKEIDSQILSVAKNANKWYKENVDTE